MDEKYFPEKIEHKWQAFWEANRSFEVVEDATRPKFYCLEMLPYPSGFLHMGHVRNYSIGDCVAWFKRLNGYNVLHPIGWDSFGQPAEQAAIKRNIQPREWTEQNIKHMRGQFKRLGISFDWSREIAAHTPEYYKFDQWFFLKMYERGLVYRRESPVNWCPREQTVLSNEQSAGGVCWRCGAAVEKRNLEQWFIKTTDYAEQLLDDMREIEAGWSERVLTMQRNWIGRSVGAFIDFPLKDSAAAFELESRRDTGSTYRHHNSLNGNAADARDDAAPDDLTNKIRVFTTRIDTVFGATAIVLAAEHPMIERLVKGTALEADVMAFVNRIVTERGKTTSEVITEEIEKQGINTGAYVINPFSGEQLPVWVGNYVLINYGSGAVMSVPAHDERDFEFAQKYKLTVRRVIAPVTHDKEPSGFEASYDEDVSHQMTNAEPDYGLLVNSGEWSGKLSDTAMPEMAAYAEQHGFGGGAVTYRLRDWGISRQRFWGAPIPIIYCQSCGIVPVAEQDLPVRLPESGRFTGTGESPLASVKEFVEVACPTCDEPARRETDTMDTFVDSSWYYFRYCDSHHATQPFDTEKIAYWFPVDLYIGGIEHAVMHLLYTRFWTKMMRDLGLVTFNEPVKKLLTQGMVTNIVAGKNEWKAMSKSLGNGVDPDEMVGIYGADAVRLFTMFAAPPENELRWMETGIEGAVRFLRRVYATVYRWRTSLHDVSLNTAHRMAADSDKLTNVNATNVDTSNVDATNVGMSGSSNEARGLRQATHRTIARVTHDLERLHFNTAIAALMELMNAIADFKADPETASDAERLAMREALEAMVIMLAPFAPHAAEEMWQGLGYAGGLLNTQGAARWMSADEVLAKRDTIEVPVQVNGKLRARLHVAADATESEIRTAAMNDERIKAHVEGRELVKTVVVPNRLINIVVR